MYSIAKGFKRFVASGAIETTGSNETCGILVNALSGDATVNIYDASGATVAERFFGVHHQPGTSEFYPIAYKIRNGGYVEITGSAEVFVYLA